MFPQLVGLRLVLFRNLMFQLMTVTFVSATPKQDLTKGPPLVLMTPQLHFSLFLSIFGKSVGTWGGLDYRRTCVRILLSDKISDLRFEQTV